MLSRHGIRYPGKKDLVNGHALMSQLQRHGVRPSTLNHLQSVLDLFPLSQASLLTPAGAKEQFHLGRRTGQRFASTFHKNDHLTFVSSSTPRAVSSAKNFAEGFNKGAGWNGSLTYRERDDLLRFFDLCPQYITQVKTNKSAFAEYEKFRSSMFPHIVQRILSRLSTDGLNISDGNVCSA